MKRPTFSRTAIVVLLLLFGLQLFAQNYVPFTPRYDEDIKGDILLIGNNILGPSNDPFNNNNVYNHNVDMQYIDIDMDPTTFSSSSADLEIPNPNCYVIRHASLYWGAVNPGTAPITEVKIKGPIGDYIDVTGEIIYDAGGSSVDGGNSFSYACYADVTDYVTGLGTDLGTYTVANVSSDTGQTALDTPFNGTGHSAGWSLFVVYEDPTLPGKSITSFDGFSAISVPGGNTTLDVPVDGFRTVPAPAPVRANFAFATLEGDKPILGDRLRLNGTSLSTLDRPVSNFFNSSVTQLSALPVNNRVPNSTNTLGFDTGVIRVPNPGNSVIANDATSGVVRLETSGDTYFPYFFAFAVEIIEPYIVLTKIVEDDAGNDIGGQTIGLGAPLNYVIGFQNIGNDNATNFRIRDILPINIIYNHPTDLVLPPGVTVTSYDPVTRELILEIEDSLVEENDPYYEIRIEVQTVETCQDLADSCSNLILNQAFATYNGFYNPDFEITDDPSVNTNAGCLVAPQATNFLADLDDCTFIEEIVLCGSSVQLTAANGYDSYAWSTSPTGTPVIGTSQTITVTEADTYYVFNTAIAPCQSTVQQFNVELFGGDIPNPVIPYADQVVTCPNNGKLLPNIFLCGLDDTRFIETNIASATSIIWDQLDESSCAAVTDPDCANEDDSCVWNEVATGPDFLADSAGQFRLTVNFEGGCFVQFYFNVYQNLLDPSAVATDIICTTEGSITVNDVPSGYEYSLDNANWQTSNVFPINTPGNYTVYIRQIGIPTNPCVFTVLDVQVNERNFTGEANVIQPLCYGDLGDIQIVANDADPQYSFFLYQGATLINSVGPITENTYTFENLNPGTYTASLETENGCVFSEDVTIIEPPILSVTASITTPLTCEDGLITINAQGGTAPYFYFINGSTDFQTVNEIIVTAPGTYDILVVDSNNCEAQTTITIDTVPPPDFTISTTDILCADTNNAGEISINVTNTNGYTLAYSIDGGGSYSNSPLFTGLAAGDYDVVVQYTLGSAICTTTPQTVTIFTESAISGLAELTSDYTCTTTGTITVTGVTGGNPPYEYSIDGVNFQSSNVFTGLTAGTYSIIIRDDNDCTFVTNDIVIDPLDPPTDLTFDNTPLSCPSNITDITITSVTGGTGTIQYQIIAPAASATAYQTSNIFIGLAPDTYTFQVIDENDCTYIESYTIDPLPVSTVNVSLTETLNCTATPDAVITGTITGPAPYTYAVSIDGGVYVDLGATTNTFVYTTAVAGTYQFQIIDANGCIAESTEITVNPITPPVISAVVQTEPILCNGDTNGAIDITIDPNSGTPAFTINVFNTTTSTDYGTQTSGLPAGDYVITVTDALSCTTTENITITQPDPIVVDYQTIDITCTAGGISQGSIIINSVTGGTSPYTYLVNGTNGYTNSEINASGTTSVSFDVVDFGLYEITVIDANGCTIVEQDVIIASPPTDLDISVNTTVDCTTGGEAVVSVGATLPSAGPFFFAIYQGPGTVYPNPPGAWIPEDFPGAQFATFTGLTPGVLYTFIVYDASTLCTYYEPATTSIPTNSTLTASAVSFDNVTCTGSDDGTVSFTVNSTYGTAVNISYEIFDSLSLNTTGVTGTGTVAAGGSLTVTDLGPLAPGNYFVNIVETSGPNNGCGIVTAPFNITESPVFLDLAVSVDQNANCNAASGVISAIGSNGTAPYQYQITTTPTAPTDTDPNWNATSVFNVDAGDYYVHVLDSFGCIVSSPLTVVPQDPTPDISATINTICGIADGDFEISVALINTGIAPYSFSIDGGAFQTMTAPFTISNLYSGTHTVEIQDANGCGNIVSVDIPEPLEFSADVTADATCNDNDGEITLNPIGGSGNYSYTISPNPAGILLVGNTYTNVPSGVYNITIDDTTTGCADEVTIAISEATEPTITLTSTIVTCFGDNSGTIEVLVDQYSGPYDYEVFDSSGTSVFGVLSGDTGVNPLIINNLNGDTYTIQLTETADPFCTVSGTIVVSSPPSALTIDAIETANVTCDNSQGIITATADGGWGTYEFELTGDATVPYSSNNVFENLSAGNYTVNVRDEEGCIATIDITLDEPDPITATFTPSTTMLACFGDQDASITITNVIGGQGANYLYTLNTISPIPSVSGPQSSNVFNDLGPGVYSVTITDSFDCTMTSLDIVIDEPQPIQASLVVDTTQTCLIQSAITLSATGGTGSYEYSTDASFTTILGTFNTSITFDVTDGTYMYYVRDANGCISNVSNEITIEEFIDLTIELASDNPTINCTGDNTGTITATAQGGLGNYVYTLQDTLGNTITATQNTPGVFTELVAGTYVVFVESGDCDLTSQPITITEPDNPLVVDFNVNNITCTGNNDGMVEIIASGGTGTILYAISPQLDQFFTTNIFENLEGGDYVAIIQDELGCYELIDFTIVEPDPVIITLDPDSIFEETCSGDANGAFSIDITGGTLPYSVSLDDYDGPYTQGGPTQTIFDFNNLNGGDHIVYVRDAQGCESEWNITFPEAITINPVAEIEYLCTNNILSNTVTVIVDDSLDPSDLDYAIDGGPYQVSNIFNDVAVGSHFIEVRHTNGCIQTTEIFVIDDIQPVTLNLTEGSGTGEIIAEALGGTGIYTFTLNDEDYGSTNVFYVTEEGTYVVIVTDSAGCQAEAMIEIEFTGPCIPNYFSPNNDGIADDWGPGCVEDFPNLTFDIFDRYGRKVATYRAGEYWDGTYNGTELPTGDYWYVVKTNSEIINKEYVGHFTLYR